MPYDLLVYKEINWKLIPANYGVEIAKIEGKYPSGASRDKALSNFEDKVSCARTYGDICFVYPSGTLSEPPAPNSKFYAILVTTGNYESAKERAFSEYRLFEYERTLNDTNNHIYEYRIWVAVPFHYFKVNEFINLPVDASLISKSPTEINVRLTPLLCPAVIKGKITPIERRNFFQQFAKFEINSINKVLLLSKYRIRLENLPPVIKNRLESERIISVTQAQLLDYLEDKVG